MSEIDPFLVGTVEGLKAKGEWCGLIRCFIAHDGHLPALDAATALLRQHVEVTGEADSIEALWEGLLLNRQGAAAIERLNRLQARLQASGRSVEGITLVLLLAYDAVHAVLKASVNWTSPASQAPTTSALPLVRLGIELALQIQDVAAAGSLALLLANASGAILRHEDRFELAWIGYSSYQSLISSNSWYYARRYAEALDTLVVTLGLLGRIEEQKRAAFDLVDTCKALVHLDKNRYLAHYVRSLCRLASLLVRSEEYPASLRAWTHAIALKRELHEGCSETTRTESADILGSIGICLMLMGRNTGAVKALERANDIHRELAAGMELRFRVALALGLTKISTLYFHLGLRDKAIKASYEAIGIYNELPVELRRCLWQHEYLACLNIADINSPTTNPALANLSERQQALRDAMRCLDSATLAYRDEVNRRQNNCSFWSICGLLIETAVTSWEIVRDDSVLSDAMAGAEGIRQRALLDRFRSEVALPVVPEPLLSCWRRAFEELDALRLLLPGVGYRRNGDAVQDLGRDLPEADAGSAGSASFALDGMSTAQTISSLVEAEQRHRGLLLEVHRHDPDFDPYGLVSRATLDDALALSASCPEIALVEYIVTDAGGFALLVQGSMVQAVRIPALNCEKVRGMADVWRDGYPHPSASRSEALASLEVWGKGIEDKLARFAPQVLWPVLKGLALLQARGGMEASRVILCPHHLLNLLPIHAMPLTGSSREVLCDRYEVSYIPSVSILKHCARRRPGSGSAFVFGNPTQDLHFMGAGIEALRGARPDVIVVHGSEAKCSTLLDRAAEMGQVEIWAHMKTDSNPMDAGIMFSGGEVLRLRGIYRDLRLRLFPHLVLNGCESGLMNPIRQVSSNEQGSADPDFTDFDGLPMGFLLAGARSVVSTLWSVYDLSSALLMDRYHLEMERAGATPVGALRRASLWLRNEIRSGAELMAAGEDLLERVPASWAKRFPERMEHCRWYLERMAEEHPHDPPFASPIHWASHYVTGWCWDPVNFDENTRSNYEPGPNSVKSG